MNRTFVIGDIHGDLDHLERLFAKLPELDADDTVVFLGDYIDRGPKSLAVVERVESFRSGFDGKCITLRGNHEDAWIESYQAPNPAFLIQRHNGCWETMENFVDTSAMSDTEKAVKLLDPKSWFPEWLYDWMRRLPVWHEDKHGIYVHAGLEGEGVTWLTPQLSKAHNVMWMREPDFYLGYKGKTLVFGHTITSELPLDHLTWFQKAFDDKGDVWFRGNLIGIDTGCGKGGFLSAIELPSKKVYESR